MQNAVRLSEQDVRAMYERRYRTWLNIRDLASDNDQLIGDCLSSMQTAFPKHPQFPKDIKIDQVFTNVAIIRGRSTWAATSDTNHVPSFDQDTIFQVAWDKPTQINATPKPKNLKATPMSADDREQDHIPILIHAWAYILPARWTELIHEAQISQGPNGKPLYSPWSIRPVLNESFPIAKKITARSRGAVRTPTSSAAARGYWSDYCSLHEIEDQKLVALMDALLIPVAKYDGRSIELSRPVLSYGKGRRESSRSRPYRMDKSQFDKLLTLGCNPRGIKALLGSVFYEPNVECNICGIWLQGSFALLNQFNDDNALSRTLIRRDPDIGALWVGAFMTGAHHQCLQRAQAAWWNIDLKVAAWTDTPMSFIQEPISAFSGLKLKFLVQTNAEHVLCGKDHRLVYLGFAWISRDQATRKQGSQTATSFRLKCSPTTECGGIADVDYDDIDSEDEDSEMVTRNIFTWLRGEDGFPAPEKEIREHPWMDNFEDGDDDDVPNNSYAGSTTGITSVDRWLLRASTQRSNSI
ncbi:hypothetical protein NOF04DRAFT_1368879 [Fusarium oxysporum II5]|nr:hypothetical protein NOF04DRAFT_1368879 [Fusarium oxysporum II5]